VEDAITEFDISIVLNLHDEVQYLVRTLQSLSEAAVYAHGFGVSIELVAVLDRPSPSILELAQRADLHAFQGTKIIEVDNGSLGLSRNDGCRAAAGHYIATADADDLISFNYLERMFFTAKRLGGKAILIPKFYLGFGASYHICEFFDLDAVTPFALIKSHPFVSRIFFERTTLQDLSYSDLRLSNEYAYEDWHFNCNAVALGYTFHACEETIVYYRQRESSLLAQANIVSSRQIPPSLLFEPARYLAACAPFLGANLLAARVEARDMLGRTVLDDPLYGQITQAAARIDPAIDVEKLRHSPSFNYLSADREVGHAYVTVSRLLQGATFNEIFLMPFLTSGGADRYVLDVMAAIVRARPATKILVLFGEKFSRYAWLDRLPPSAIHIDLAGRFPSLVDEDIDLLSLKIIQSVGINARLHLKGSVFAERFFSRFGRLLRQNRPVLYRFCDGRMSFEGSDFIEPGPFEFVSDNIEWLVSLVCDNASIIAADHSRIGIDLEKWSLLYARMEIPCALDGTRVEAAGKSRKVLWASRIDRQKRPGLLTRIAELLAQRMPDIQMDIYGSSVLDNIVTDHLGSLPNVQHHGGYDNFDTIKAGNYYCFVYTSSFDGMPNVLLEAAAAGVAIIAPNVGGVAELVRDGETGLLVGCTGDDEEDAPRYIAAMERVFADPGGRRAMIENAFSLLAARHAPNQYQANVVRIFGLDDPSKPAAEPLADAASFPKQLA
jgi:glycosyltransferase involved in cell wall biosynthesis